MTVDVIVRPHLSVDTSMDTTLERGWSSLASLATPHITDVLVEEEEGEDDSDGDATKDDDVDSLTLALEGVGNVGGGGGGGGGVAGFGGGGPAAPTPMALDSCRSSTLSGRRMGVPPDLVAYPVPCGQKPASYPLFVQYVLEHVVVLYADYTIATHKLDPTPGNSLPFTAKPGKRRPMVSSRLLCPVSSSGNSSGLSSSCFGVVWWTPKKPTISDCVFVSVGYVDGSLRWQSLDGKKHGVLMACSQRVAPVVSLSVGSDGKTLLTGHSDCTAHLWQLIPTSGIHSRTSSRDAAPVIEDLHPVSQSTHSLCHLHTLPGQYCHVSACAISINLSLIATGGSDGAIVLIELRKFRALRVLHTGSPSSATRSVLTSLLLSDSTCRLVALSRVEQMGRADKQDRPPVPAPEDLPRSGSPLWFFKMPVDEPGPSASVAEDDVVEQRPQPPAGATCNVLHLYTVYGNLLKTVELTVPVTSIALSSNGEFLLCGDAGGVITVRSLGDLGVVSLHVPGTSGPGGAGAGAGAAGGAGAPTTTPVRTLCMADNDRFIFCGVEGAPLFAITDPANTAKALQSRLKEGLFGIS